MSQCSRVRDQEAGSSKEPIRVGLHVRPMTYPADMIIQLTIQWYAQDMAYGPFVRPQFEIQDTE